MKIKFILIALLVLLMSSCSKTPEDERIQVLDISLLTYYQFQTDQILGDEFYIIKDYQDFGGSILVMLSPYETYDEDFFESKDLMILNLGNQSLDTIFEVKQLLLIDNVLYSIINHDQGGIIQQRNHIIVFELNHDENRKEIKDVLWNITDVSVFSDGLNLIQLILFNQDSCVIKLIEGDSIIYIESKYELTGDDTISFSEFSSDNLEITTLYLEQTEESYIFVLNELQYELID